MPVQKLVRGRMTHEATAPRWNSHRQSGQECSGRQQRIAIARSLSMRPKIMLSMSGLCILSGNAQGSELVAGGMTILCYAQNGL